MSSEEKAYKKIIIELRRVLKEEEQSRGGAWMEAIARSKAQDRVIRYEEAFSLSRTCKARYLAITNRLELKKTF